MFQCIANCWRGQAQLSNAIVTEFPFNVLGDPYLQKGAYLCTKRHPAPGHAPGGSVRLKLGLFGAKAAKVRPVADPDRIR